MGERLWALGSRASAFGFGLWAKLLALERNIGLSLAKDDKIKGSHEKLGSHTRQERQDGKAQSLKPRAQSLICAKLEADMTTTRPLHREAATSEIPAVPLTVE